MCFFKMQVRFLMLLFINKPQDGGEYIQFPTEVLVTVVLVMVWESFDSDTPWYDEPHNVS